MLLLLLLSRLWPICSTGIFNVVTPVKSETGIFGVCGKTTSVSTLDVPVCTAGIGIDTGLGCAGVFTTNFSATALLTPVPTEDLFVELLVPCSWYALAVLVYTPVLLPPTIFIVP